MQDIRRAGGSGGKPKARFAGRSDCSRKRVREPVNAIMTRLCDSLNATQHGLISAPLDADGRSRLDELQKTPWAQVHQLGRNIAGALQQAGVAPGDAVAVLAGAPGEIAPLVQGIWMCGASVTILHHPTRRSDLTTW